MRARYSLDVFTSITILVLAIVIVGWILPDFGADVISFLANQFALVICLSVMAFLVAFYQRKMVNVS